MKKRGNDELDIANQILFWPLRVSTVRDSNSKKMALVILGILSLPVTLPLFLLLTPLLRPSIIEPKGGKKSEEDTGQNRSS